MDESRPVEAGARHKVLRMTLLSEFQHTGRTIVVTTGIQKGSYAQSQDSFFFFLIQLFTPVLQKHLWNIFTKFLWHATQIQAFFAKKVARGYSYSGAIVNLIRRDWWEKKTTTTQQAKLLHSRFFGGLRVGTGAMVLETRGYRVVRWFLEEKKKSPPPIWALEQHWRAERRSCTMPSWAPTPPAAGCSCACRTRRCHSWGFPGWISRTLCLAWTAPETCRTQKHH